MQLWVCVSWYMYKYSVFSLLAAAKHTYSGYCLVRSHVIGTSSVSALRVCVCDVLGKKHCQGK